MNSPVSTMNNEYKKLSKNQLLKAMKQGASDVAKLQGMLTDVAVYFGPENMEKFNAWLEKPYDHDLFYEDFCSLEAAVKRIETLPYDVLLFREKGIWAVRDDEYFWLDGGEQYSGHAPENYYDVEGYRVVNLDANTSTMCTVLLPLDKQLDWEDFNSKYRSKEV